MAALYANESKTFKEQSGFHVKQVDGVWHWMGIVSNNWQDRHDEWITSAALKTFAGRVDSGEFGEMILDSPLAEMPLLKEIGERGTPDLWYWHLPVPIGYATVVAYDERDYLVAAGKQKEGEFYDEVFEKLSETEILHAMSHSMPDIFMTRAKEDPRQIADMISLEFTVMPHEEVANLGTAWATMLKEAYMHIPKRKVKYMKDVFGEEAVAKFDALLGELEIFAEDSEVPRKELVMSESTAKTEVDEVVVEEVVETDETVAKKTEVEGEEVAEDESEDSENKAEADQEEDGAGMSMESDGFQVPTNMSEFAQEISSGLKDVFAQFQANTDAKFAELKEIIETQAGEIATIKASDEEKMAQKAIDTPVASMAGWLATQVGSVIGDEGARLHGNRDKKLYDKSKEGEKELSGSAAGLPAQIQKQIQLNRAGNGRQFRVPVE